jgi:Fur family iron response transcriptional regulator
MTDRTDLTDLLKRHGIQPSVQRLAIAAVVLQGGRHPAADEIHREVRSRLPMVSRATVYNTLHLFVERGLLLAHQVGEGPTVYDANVDRHHHVIDAESGQIVDVPWEAIEVRQSPELRDWEIESYTVIMRGRRRDRGDGAPEERD